MAALTTQAYGRASPSASYRQDATICAYGGDPKRSCCTVSVQEEYAEFRRQTVSVSMRTVLSEVLQAPPLHMRVNINEDGSI